MCAFRKFCVLSISEKTREIFFCSFYFFFVPFATQYQWMAKMIQEPSAVSLLQQLGELHCEIGVKVEMYSLTREAFVFYSDFRVKLIIST